MDLREKLTKILTSEPELLKNLNVSTIKLFRLVNKMIENGVTVQEWIPVTERLPNVGEDVLVAVCDGYDSWVDTDEVLKDGRWLYFRKDRIVTHWMPLPEPPKGD